MRYLVGGAFVELLPRRLTLLWGGIPHQMIRSHDAVEVIWITVPLSIVLRWKLPDLVMRPLLAGGFVMDRIPAPRRSERAPSVAGRPPFPAQKSFH